MPRPKPAGSLLSPPSRVVYGNSPAILQALHLTKPDELSRVARRSWFVMDSAFF